MKKNKVYGIIVTFMLLFIMLSVVNTAKCSAAPIYSWPLVDDDGSDGLNADVTKSATNVSLVTFNNELYAAWSETTGEKDTYGSDCTVIRVKKYNGSSWSFADGGTTISVSPDKRSEAPKLIVYKEHLYAVWQETSTMYEIRVKKYNDDGTWTSVDGDKGINTDQSINGRDAYPIVYKDELYVVWDESNGNGKIQISKYNGSSWTQVDGTDAANGLNYDPDKNAQYPAAEVYNDKLYVTWQEFNDSYISQVRVKSFDGSSWSLVDGEEANGINNDSSKSGSYPQLITYNDELYAMWQENQNIRIKKYDEAKTTWSLNDGIDINNGLGSGYVPRAAVYNNQLYVIYHSNNGWGNNKIIVKTYDGTNWNIAYGAETSGINKDTTHNALMANLAILNGKLYAAWHEYNDSASSTNPQIRAAVMTVTNEMPKSTVATVTSSKYTVSAAGSSNETITKVQDGTSKADFIAALTKGESHESFDDKNLHDPVVSEDKLVVTAEDGTTKVTYTITVNQDTRSAAKAITSFGIGSETGTIDETNHRIAITVPYGTDVTSLTPTIAVSDKATVSPASGAAIDFTSPVTYTLTAEDGTTQNYVVTVTVGPAHPSGAPVITSEPESKQVTVGQNVSFSVSVTGDEPITYQWEKDGTAISNATGSAITLTNVQLSDAGNYTVTVSNSLGTTTSSAVALVVNPASNGGKSHDDSGSSNGGSGSGSAAAASSSQTPSQGPTTVQGSVVEGGTGRQVSSVTADVTTESNGNKTVSMKASEVAVFKEPDGSTCKFNDVSKINVSAGDGQAVTMASDGTVKVQNLANGTDNSFKVTYDLGNGQKIVVGTVEVKVGNNGEVSLTSTLIDPYGVITDVTTGKPVQGVNVTLYYANTDRNKANGKTPDTVVQLPIINGFKPNDNKDPQVSDQNGTYGFMVFPTTDYYLAAEKDGYYKYVSPTISVEQAIVKWDLRMNPVTVSSNPSGVQRLGGQTRIDTVLNIAKAAYNSKVSNVVLATSEDYADAFSGSTLAYKLNAPMLLVGGTDEEQQKVIAFMESSMDKTGNVYILGGQGAVSKAFEDKIISEGFNNITRIGGSDRYETSQKIAEKLNVNKETPIIITTGENYADALAVSSVAAVNQYPILLVRKDEIPDIIKKEISTIAPGKIFIVGLQGAVDSSVENAITQITPIDKSNIVRIGGENRYATSVETSKYFKLTGNEACIATGNGFADVLAGSVYASKHNAPIILINDALSEDEIQYLKDRKFTKTTILGGEAAVNKNVEQQLSEIIGK